MKAIKTIDTKILELSSIVNKLKSDRRDLYKSQLKVGQIVIFKHQEILDYLFNKDNNHKMNRGPYRISDIPYVIIGFKEDSSEIYLSRYNTKNKEITPNKYINGWIPSYIINGDWFNFIKPTKRDIIQLPEFKIVWGSTCIHDSNYYHV